MDRYQNRENPGNPAARENLNEYSVRFSKYLRRRGLERESGRQIRLIFRKIPKYPKFIRWAIAHVKKRSQICKPGTIATDVLKRFYKGFKKFHKAQRDPAAPRGVFCSYFKPIISKAPNHVQGEPCRSWIRQQKDWIRVVAEYLETIAIINFYETVAGRSVTQYDPIFVTTEEFDDAMGYLKILEALN